MAIPPNVVGMCCIPTTNFGRFESRSSDYRVGKSHPTPEGDRMGLVQSPGGWNQPSVEAAPNKKGRSDHCGLDNVTR
jgi:hypothetical protein